MPAAAEAARRIGTRMLGSVPQPAWTAPLCSYPLGAMSHVGAGLSPCVITPWPEKSRSALMIVPFLQGLTQGRRHVLSRAPGWWVPGAFHRPAGIGEHTAGGHEGWWLSPHRALWTCWPFSLSFSEAQSVWNSHQQGEARIWGSWGCVLLWLSSCGTVSPCKTEMTSALRPPGWHPHSPGFPDGSHAVDTCSHRWTTPTVLREGGEHFCERPTLCSESQPRLSFPEVLSCTHGPGRSRLSLPRRAGLGELDTGVTMRTESTGVGPAPRMACLVSGPGQCPRAWRWGVFVLAPPSRSTLGTWWHSGEKGTT